MSNQETYERLWGEAGALLLHPTQILILEALAHLGFPISATAMERISDGQIPLANYAYHLSRLATLGLVELVDTEQRRGALEKFYDLRPREGE